MTLDRASVEEGARLAAEATDLWRRGFRFTGFAGMYLRHWNPEFAAELARELQRLWRVEEAARRLACADTKWQF